MTIELSKEAKQTALESLQKYFEEHLEQSLGNLAGGALLNFIVEEIGPSLYNKGVADAQERMQMRLSKFRPTNSPIGANRKAAGELCTYIFSDTAWPRI
jgi:uncharacterized protein (DUF2164 family)